MTSRGVTVIFDDIQKEKEAYRVADKIREICREENLLFTPFAVTWNGVNS